jgi:ABC-type polysaccharide/polyol phosphate export permease
MFLLLLGVLIAVVATAISKASPNFGSAGRIGRFVGIGLILLGLMTWFNFVPSWRIITLPVFIAIAFAASMGAGLWLAALAVLVLVRRRRR